MLEGVNLSLDVNIFSTKDHVKQLINIQRQLKKDGKSHANTKLIIMMKNIL